MSSLTNEANYFKQGVVGEVIIAEVLKQSGNQIQIPDDWYDDKKDGVVDGETYEVKTLVKQFMKNEFVIKFNQERKVLNVDRFFVVEVPINKEIDYINIWELKDRRFQVKQMFSGKNIAFPVSHFEKYCVVRDADLAKYLYEVCPTTYKT